MKPLQLTLAILLLFASTGTIIAQDNSLVDRLSNDALLTDLGGNTISLKEAIAKVPAVICFTTTWCSDCKKLSLIMDKLIPEFSPKGIHFINVYVGQKKKQLEKTYGASIKSDAPIRFLDSRRLLSRTLSITSVPTLIMVDAKGKIRYEGFSLDENLLAAKTASLMN